MNGLSKLALKMGGKPIALLTLIISCASVFTKRATAESINKKFEGDQPDKFTEIERDEDNSVELDAKIFKAYDIRGIVGQTLNEQIMMVIGQAIGSEAKDQGQTRLVVGRDGRLSSDSLAKALIDGIVASGCGVVDIGQVPTPLVYFACEHLGTHSGVMVTGSHNPPEYNGLKIVLAGKAIDGEALQQLYQRIEQEEFHFGSGSKNVANVIEDYIDRIVSDVKTTRSIKVVIDCGNGVAGIIAPKLLQALGCEVIELYCDVDGNFPNHHPNPGQPENLQDLIVAVQQHEAELGIAFDGDGDRIGVVDVNGQPIWPDRLMVMFAQDVLAKQPGATIIYDVKSSNLLAEAISRAGGEGLMWRSGHSIIKNKMKEVNAALAGEMSGHIFFKERWYGFDDGLYTACRLLELLASDPLERTPTEVFSAIPNRENTPEILIDMDEDESRLFMQQLVDEAQFSGARMTTIDGLRADYPDGWGLVRVSNTMPGLTLRFEADTVEDLHYIQQQFKQKMLQVKPTLTLLF
jgi:phosphomannomutase/phosphoglucomutase